MAKINIATRQTTHHRVLVSVQDPHCIFSIKPCMEYMKVFKASGVNQAIRAAARYCNLYMQAYPGTTFKYSTEQVEPYNYHERKFEKED